ncbi:MAG: hypothetical protein FWJ74_05195 [Gemmatimonadota bacterium]
MRARSAVLTFLLAALLIPGAAVAQESAPTAPTVRTAVAPDTVLVGDVFRVAIRVELPPGYRATFPDSLPVSDPLEAAGRRAERVETLPDGGRRITAVYSMTAWRPGAVELPPASIRLSGPDGERVVEARLPGVSIRSVLPEDTAGIQPRDLKDVLGGNRTWWPLLLALLVGAVAVGGLVYWRRRGREAPLPVYAAIPPRERALAALDRARNSGLVEAGKFKTFYSLVTGAVRLYLEETDRSLGAELTTTELMERAERTMSPDVARTLGRLLASADLVKFARRRPSPEDALADWEAARGFVLTFGREEAP